MEGTGGPWVGVELELPKGEHRERLLLALANLVRRRGFESLVAAPILLPRSEYRWEPTLAGARRLLRRLMHYAGLGDLEVRLLGWRERAVTASAVAPEHREGHAAAWFGGVRDGICEFGLELDGLRHEESLVAALGHEVAHAYRDHHGLVVMDRDLEEKLTDLTTVYLGFGAFALNASHVLETGGYNAAGERLLYESRSLGYLSPAEFALLLSATLALRADQEEQRAVLEELSTNHAALVEQGCRELGEDLDGLRALLGVPPPASWPARYDVVGKLPEIPDDDPSDAPSEPEPEPESELEEGAGIAFRVQKTRAIPFLIAGLGTAGLLGVLTYAESYLFYAGCAFGGVAGHWLGKGLRTDECSGCGTRLPLDAARCARCGARIVGEIRTHEERLEAEERYAAQRAEAASEGQAEDDPHWVLASAMLVAWALRRGFMAEDAADPLRELARRVESDDYDTAALSLAWKHEAALLTPEAIEFAEHYFYQATALFEGDLRLLATANELDDRRANYERFAVILDRRFAEWQARSERGGGPSRATGSTG